MFSSKKNIQPPVSNQTLREFNLIQNFSQHCIHACLKNNNIVNDLEPNQKKCLAKCIDRSYDYLKIIQNVKI